MFRIPVGEFRLSSGKGSGRSFRPECEALEERIVPDATESLAPSSHAPLVDPRLTASVQLFTSQLELLQARIEHKAEQLHRFEDNLNVAGSEGAEQALSRLEKSADKIAFNVFNPAVNKLANADTLMDPEFQQAFNAFKDALVNLQNTIQQQGHHFGGLTLP